MALEYSISYQDAFIEVSVRGVPDYLSLDRLWHDVADACNRHDCFKILGISETKTWSEFEPYDTPAQYEAAEITTRHRIAWIEKNVESKESVKVCEAVIKNRGAATARAFDDPAEAKRWLLEADQAIA